MKVACIGMGWWSDVLADAIKRSGKLTIASCYSRSQDKREKFAARIHDLFAHPDHVVFGNESASAALTRFAAAVDHVVVEDAGGDVVIVSHGTVISLFVAKRADVDGEKLWATLGLPSYVSLELPNHRIVEIVATL